MNRVYYVHALLLLIVENRSQRLELPAEARLTTGLLSEAHAGVEGMFHDEGKAWLRDWIIPALLDNGAALL